MKTNFILPSLLIFFSTMIIVSCKKDKHDELDAKVEQFTADANTYKTESDQIDNDINDFIKDIPAFGKVSGIETSPLCGATVDSTDISQKILYFNFDGVTPCFSPSRTRAGQIKVQLTTGSKWSDAGSILTITYINFKVVRLKDNKSIMFNGVKTLKNMNGHNWLTFINGTGSHKYSQRALNIQVTFDNNMSAVWNSARVTEWSYTPTNPKFVFSAKGDTTLGSQVNVDMWGTNRHAQSFTTHYNTAILSNTYCGLWRPISGELVHLVNGNSYTLTLGVDQQGNPTPHACAYGYKVSWNVNGHPGNKIISY
jgi:hypothetical protein